MADVQVTFINNKQTTETTMSKFESVLEAALKARIDPPYSCLEGVCGSCMAYLEEGEVDSVEGTINTLSPDRNFRTCQAQPKSNKLKINFDKANG